MAPSSANMPSDIPGKEEMGARLRAERKARKMTLQTLSKASGIAVSTLSKAELGRIALSYEKFAALAQALDVDMSRLFMRGDGAQAAVAPTFVKNAMTDALDYVNDNYHYRVLMGQYPAKRMAPILAIIEARKVEEFEDYIRHPGQEFAIVLSGKVRIQFENGESVVLNRFESAYFDSGMGHVYLNMSKSPAQVLAVCSDTGDLLPDLGSRTEPR